MLHDIYTYILAYILLCTTTLVCGEEDIQKQAWKAFACPWEPWLIMLVWFKARVWVDNGSHYTCLYMDNMVVTQKTS